MNLLPILLPEGFISKVSANDKLTAGDVIAEKKGKGKEEIVHLSSDLGVSPSEVKKYLKKNLGDGVKNGEVIAVKKGIFKGLKIKSPFLGTVVKIDEGKGDVYIQTEGEGKNESIFSPVDGTVDFCNNEKIVIKTDKEAIIAEDCVGEEAEGEIFQIEKIDFNNLTSDISDKVIAVRKLDKVSLFKIIGLGANAVITEEIDDIDFIDLVEKRIKTPVMNVTDEDFKKIIKKEGRKVYLNAKVKSILIL